MPRVGEKRMIRLQPWKVIFPFWQRKTQWQVYVQKRNEKGLSYYEWVNIDEADKFLRKKDIPEGYDRARGS